MLYGVIPNQREFMKPLETCRLDAHSKISHVQGCSVPGRRFKRLYFIFLKYASNSSGGSVVAESSQARHCFGTNGPIVTATLLPAYAYKDVD